MEQSLLLDLETKPLLLVQIKLMEKLDKKEERNLEIRQKVTNLIENLQNQ